MKETTSVGFRRPGPQGFG